MPAEGLQRQSFPSSTKRQRQAKQISKIAAEYLQIQENEAREAGALGYLGRCVVQATLPHSDPAPEYSFERKNGSYTFAITAPKSIGLPYGIFPRLVLIWLSGEVVRTQETRLFLGDHLAEFMRALDLTPTGGKNGSITYLRDQLKRLFSSSIDFFSTDPGCDKNRGCKIAEAYDLWWKPSNPEQPDLWKSWVELSPKFFAELRDFSVPIDLRRVKMLRRSPLALDIYTWWTYRFSYLTKQTEVPWEALFVQFGADYKTMFHFREAFRAAVARARQAYPEANIAEGKSGLILRPSRTSILKLLPLPTVASEKRASQWINRHQHKFQQFLRQLELMKETAVGVQITNWNAEMTRRARLASQQADVPLDIAYRVINLQSNL
jgi:hypothetical protein